jgi:hypothetical protein
VGTGKFKVVDVEDGSRNLKQTRKHCLEVGFIDFACLSLCCFADRRPVVRIFARMWHVRI